MHITRQVVMVDVDVVAEVVEEGKYMPPSSIHSHIYVYLMVPSSIPIHTFIPAHDRRGGGMKGGQKVVIEPHRHEGVFIARSKEDALVTLNSTPGKDVYGEKRIQVFWGKLSRSQSVCMATPLCCDTKLVVVTAIISTC